MADYLSTHTGSSIDKVVDAVESGDMTSSVLNAGTPSLSASDSSVVTVGWYNAKFLQDMSYQHPIGYIFEWSKSGLSNAPDLTTPQKVANYFGYGTWELFGTGKVLVGINSSDSSFSTDGATGGSKDAVVVSHTHTQASHSHNMGEIFSGGSGKKSAYATSARKKLVQRTTESTTPTINSTGESGTNKNLQPYIVVYRYRRIG